MSAQGTFPFISPSPWRPKRPERLVFMLFPDADTSNYIDWLRNRLIQEFSLEGKDLLRERLHMSLHHIGDYKSLRSAVLYAASLAARAVSATSFQVTLRSIVSFPPAPRKKDRPLVLLGESDGLLHLHQSLALALRKNGLRASDDLTPHMTLSYAPKGIPLQSIEPIRFVANEFALVHSMRGLSKYNVLERWPLAG